MINYKDKDFLYNLYIINNKSVRQIQKITGVKSKSTIIYWLEKTIIGDDNLLDIKRKSKNVINHTKDSLYEEHITKHKSVSVISKESNVTPSTILRWMRNFNIPLRPYQEDSCLDLVGKVFGELTVIKPFYCKRNKYNKRTRLWICKCKCGTELQLNCQQLSTGYVSCGCARRKLGYNEIMCSFFSSIRNGAIQRNLEFNITIEQIWDLFLKQDRKCALSGVEIKFRNYEYGVKNTASLDRIDNSRGYTVDNVQWVFKDLNFMKQDFTEEEFFGWIKKIYEYKKL